MLEDTNFNEIITDEDLSQLQYLEEIFRRLTEDLPTADGIVSVQIFNFTLQEKSTSERKSNQLLEDKTLTYGEVALEPLFKILRWI